MADTTVYTPLSGWTDNGDGSWTPMPRSDGSSYNVDAVLAELLARPTITVSDTAPTNPRTNDLWFKPA